MSAPLMTMAAETDSFKELPPLQIKDVTHAGFLAHRIFRRDPLIKSVPGGPARSLILKEFPQERQQGLALAGMKPAHLGVGLKPGELALGVVPGFFFGLV